MQKTIGVLTGTGGVADELPDLAKKINKEGQGEIFFDNNPKSLVEKLLAVLKSQGNFTAS
jgi:glycogen synthase